MQLDIKENFMNISCVVASLPMKAPNTISIDICLRNSNYLILDTRDTQPSLKQYFQNV